MPFHLDSQRLPNVVTADGQIPDTQAAQLLIMPFVKGVRIYQAEDGWFVDDSLNGTSRRLTGNTYTPNFVCRAITTNDPDTDGEEVLIDTPQTTRLLLRIYAGTDRPIIVTRVHLGNLGDIRDIILWR